MTHRYQGTVNKTNGDGTFGYIKRTTITDEYGKPVRLETAKDIYIHEDDCDGRLYAGLTVSFEVVADKARPNAFRASDVWMDYEPPIKDGIEIHFDQQVIDHPTVPVRWCISPEILGQMREDADTPWALVFVAQERKPENGSSGRWNRMKNVVKVIDGIKNIGAGRGFITFKSPGDYDLVAYLLKSRDEVKDFYKRLKTFVEEPDDVQWVISDSDSVLCYHRKVTFMRSYDTVTSFVHCVVSVPAEIFAKPLPEWVKAWLGYFRLNRPKDECAMRGRLIFAFTLGVVMYVAWEGLKRTWMFLMGIMHFLFGGNPLPVWKSAFGAQLSAYMSGFTASREYEPMMSYKGWRFLFIPIVPAVPILGTLAWFFLPWFQGTILTAIGVVAAIITILGAIWLWGFISELLTERNRDAATQKALATVEKYATCGYGEPAKGPMTVTLMWDGIKRAVCRSYG